MGELTYDQLVGRLTQGRLGGNYFLKTEDSFLRDEAIALLIRAHFREGPSDFDLDQTSGEDVDAASLASLLATPPLLSDHRVVVIRDAQSLSRSARVVVEEAVSREVVGTVLVAAAAIPRGSKAKFYEILSKKCVTVSLRAPRSSELPGWLARRAKSLHGLVLELEAAQLLAAAIGGRLGALAQELEKLATYVGAGGAIGVAEVRAAVGALPLVDRWGWVDKVGERSFADAVSELPELLDSGESAVSLISALTESLIRIGLAREGRETLVNVLKRDGSYGYLSWKVRAYMAQSRRWTPEAVEHGLRELLRADRLIKSGGLAERAALEEALLRIAAFAETDEPALV